jgi:hypothetical protein
VLAIAGRDDPASNGNVAENAPKKKKPSPAGTSHAMRSPKAATAPTTQSAAAANRDQPSPTPADAEKTPDASPKTATDRSTKEKTEDSSPSTGDDDEKKPDAESDMPDEPDGDLSSLLKKGDADVDEPEPTIERSPVPSDEERKGAEAEIRKLYAEDFAKKKPADVANTAGKLLTLARESQGEPLTQYALLELARSMSTEIGDVVTAMTAADRIATNFKVDALELKTQTLVALGKGPLHHSLKPKFYELAWPVVQELMRQDRFEVVPQLTGLLLPMAQSYQDRQTVATIRQTEKDAATYKKHFDELAPAFAALVVDPKDGAANRKIGEFYSFVKGHWSRGLRYLVKGDDEKLRSLAEADRAAPMDPDERLALADRWRAVAEGLGDKHRKTQVAERAAYWYELAKPQLAGLTKSKVEQTLKELPLRPRHHADAVSFGGHWYKLFTEPVTWAEATAKCERMGGTLMCIETQQDYVFAYRVAGRIVKDQREVWIGGTDESSEGKFQWVNGSALVYFVWDPGQPDNAGGGEHYLVLWPRGWNDRPAGHRAMFICEWER